MDESKLESELVAILRPQFGDRAEEVALDRIALGQAIKQCQKWWYAHPIKAEFDWVYNALDHLSGSDYNLEEALQQLAEETKDDRKKAKAKEALALVAEYYVWSHYNDRSVECGSSCRSTGTNIALCNFHYISIITTID